MVHDWFVHKKGTWTHTHDIPLDDGDTWHERPMRVPKTPADPPKVPGSTRPPAYINENTHWWDGSQVYGSSPASAGVAPRRPRRQGAGQPERPAGRRSGHRQGDHRLHRERLGRSEPAARAVCARAQRDLRQAQAAQSALGRRAAVPAGAPRQLRRCSRRSTRSSGRRRSCRGEVTQHRPARPTGTAGSASCRTCSRSSPTTTSSPAFPARRPSTTACRFR